MWQRELLNYRDEKGRPYSDTYLRSVNNQLSVILNYATVYYHIPSNPCKRVGLLWKSNAEAMQIWTLDEFERFIELEKSAPATWLLTFSFGVASGKESFWLLPSKTLFLTG